VIAAGFSVIADRLSVIAARHDVIAARSSVIVAGFSVMVARLSVIMDRLHSIVAHRCVIADNWRVIANNLAYQKIFAERAKPSGTPLASAMPGRTTDGNIVRTTSLFIMYLGWCPVTFRFPPKEEPSYECEDSS
jgi:hypothetical protein